MKEASNKSLESLFDKVTKSKLPNWAKTTIALSIFLSPLLEYLSRWILLKQVAEIVSKLLGL